MTAIISVLTIVGIAIAAAAIKPMRDVAMLAPTPRLQRAWWTLVAMIVTCIALQLGAFLSRLHAAVGVGEVLEAIVHLLGPSFVLATAWLARRTAQDILRMADLERAALIDPLTTLPNRRFFDAALTDQIRECRKIGAPFHLVLLDIDHFKCVNDRFGHAAGDRVLRQVGALMQGVVREQDRVCRIGGEEFAIMFPGSPTVQVMASIERTRTAIERTKLDLARGETTAITASLGAATLVPGDTAETLFARADVALYAAKHAGRNRTRLAA